jgi:hypothetical protein
VLCLLLSWLSFPPEFAWVAVMDPSAVSGTVKEDIVELDSYSIGQLNVMVGSPSVFRSFLG